MDLGPVGDVRVVTGILDHETGGRITGKALAVERKGGGNAGGKSDCHFRDALLPRQHQGRALCGCRSAGAGGVAVA